MKKIFISLTIYLVVCALCIPGLAVYGNGYNAQAALQYAEAHWNDGVGLCAQFVSACLKAGGLSTYSASGTSLHTQLMQSELGTEYAINLNSSDRSISMSQYEGKISAGDPVFYYCSSCESQGKRPYIHTVLCNGADANGYMKAYAHNAPKNGQTKFTYNRTCYQCDAVLTQARVYHLVSNVNPIPPTNVSLSTDAQFYTEHDFINFDMSADNSESNYMEIYRNGISVWTGNPTGDFSYTPNGTGKYTASFTASNSGGSTSSNQVEFTVGVGSRSVSGDFNGDGKDDYATLFDYGNSRSQWHVFLSTGTDFSEEIWWEELNENWYGCMNSAGRVTAGDFNGDGMDDVAIMYEYDGHNSQIHVFPSTGKSFDEWQIWFSDATGYESHKVADRFISGDFNGDGLDDIAAMYSYDGHNSQIHVFLSTGGTFENWQTWFADDTGYEAHKVSGRFTSGDFNGDGMDDIAAMYSYDGHNSQIHVFLSAGGAFENWQTWFADSTGYEAHKVSGRFISGDFNGDGVDDIVEMYNYGEYHDLHVFLSNKTEFQPWKTWISETQFNPLCVTGRFVSGDFDGDGTDDIATMYNYDDSYITFHMFMSDKTKFNHEWWNRIDNYNAARTTGFKAYTDNYSQTFAFSHRHTYIDTVIDPTCTNDGYTIHACTNGDYNYRDEITAATGHKWTEWEIVSQPTYTEKGKESRNCDICGITESRDLEMLTPVPEVYNVILNTNGGTINSGNITNYTYGEGATLPTDVTKEGYVFGGWYDNEEYTGTAVTEITADETGNKMFYAKWTKIEPMGYEIRFVNYDGVVLQRKTVTAGETPSYTGVSPEKAQDEYYTYTFSGWSPSITAAQNDATYTAQFTQTPRSYSVDLSTNGGVINGGNITSYTYGKGVVLPTDVTRDGYTFCGWYDNSSLTGTAVTAISSSETGDKTYYAKWEQNAPEEYTITFVNYDGSVLQSGNVTAGTMPVYSGEIPERAADSGYSYTFSGWSPALSAVSGNTTYTAQFTGTPRVYSIRYNTDGGTINSGVVTSYTYGIGAALPTNVSKPGYIFNGWYAESDFSGSSVMSISATESGSKVYYAKWTQDAPTEYLISFVNYDNSVLQSSYVPIGEMPEYYGAVPERPADSEYTYTFAGWEPEIEEVSGIATYTAKYDIAPIEYTDSVEYDADTSCAVITVSKTGTYTVIFAAYDINGALTSIEIKDTTFDSKGIHSVYCDTFNAMGANAVKVMLWDDLQGMIPICNADAVY